MVGLGRVDAQEPHGVAACRRRTATTTVSPSIVSTTVARVRGPAVARPPAYQPHPTLPSRAAATGHAHGPGAGHRRDASAQHPRMRTGAATTVFGHARPAPARCFILVVVARRRGRCLRLHVAPRPRRRARRNVDTTLGRATRTPLDARYDAARGGERRRCAARPGPAGAVAKEVDARARRTGLKARDGENRGRSDRRRQRARRPRPASGRASSRASPPLSADPDGDGPRSTRSPTAAPPGRAHARSPPRCRPTRTSGTARVRGVVADIFGYDASPVPVGRPPPVRVAVSGRSLWSPPWSSRSVSGRDPRRSRASAALVGARAVAATRPPPAATRLRARRLVALELRAPRRGAAPRRRRALLDRLHEANRAAARARAAPVDGRARRQEGADRPAARHDDGRARQGRRARARRSTPTGARRSASSRNELQRQHEGLNALTEHTRQLREALASQKVRGQWGERMAEDVLRLAGFLEGVNYRQQATLAGSGGRPDYTFLLPNGLVMHMDVKFPLDNYVRFLEADDRPRAQAVPRPVPPRRARPRAGARRRAATSTPATRPSTACCCSSRTSRCTRSCRSTTARSSTTRCATRSCCARRSRCTRCSRSCARRSTTSGSRRTSNEILALLGEFSRQWEKYVAQLDKVQQRFDGGRQGVHGADDAPATARCSARSTRSRRCATRSPRSPTPTSRRSPSRADGSPTGRRVRRSSVASPP